ncbi:hypothetical protein VTK73DRAFT_3164 [Phialemonium thermophilum]|uniref:Extracellular membrane protein CFEM domain-containing protein n=1 Tax=Phialemonium thermophilum TaxID=223376 RepID=A0ABR3X163_9PEZI
MTVRSLFSGLISMTGVASADAAKLNPSRDVFNFVPSCAQTCFQSFISANFDVSTCGITTSLDCLCVKTGKSGFTIGEGAVQCIVAESNRDSCRGSDASRQAVTKAYGMCAGVAGAAPATHATIVATLIIPSGTGAVVVPAPTHSSTLSTQPTSSTRTARTTTSVAPSVSPLSITSVSTPAAVSSQGPVSTTASPSSSSSAPKLNTAQIAGMSAGIVAALILALVLILMARRVRKKTLGPQSSKIFQARQSGTFGRLKSTNNSPHALQISAPIHKTPIEMDFRRPGDDQAITPNTIGLALSPPPSVYSKEQTSQSEAPARDLDSLPPDARPPKPLLSVSVPPHQRQRRQHTQMSLSERESVVTEFAEDGDGDTSAATSIWRPPAPHPQSTSTYYVADKQGNWALGGRNGISPSAAYEQPGPFPSAETGRYMQPLPEIPTEDEERSQRSSSQPTDLMAKLGSPIVFKERLARDPASVSPSIYSTFNTPTIPLRSEATLHRAKALFDSHPRPMGKGSMEYVQGSVRERDAQQGNSRRVRKRNSAVPAAMQARAADLFEDEDIIEDEPQEGISPFTESPQTPISPGVSPVTYPKIPGRERNGKAVQDNPMEEHLSPSHRSGLVPAPLEPNVPQRIRRDRTFPNTSAIFPPQASALGISGPIRDPGLVRTGSPEHRRASKSLEMEEQRQQRERRDGTKASNTSTLLTKRLGADRAVALAPLKDGDSRRPGRPSRSAAKWRRENAGNYSNHQGDDSNRRDVGAARGPGLVIDGVGYVAVPSTQEWKPKLTPTRQGDDLFLNVQ